MRLSDEIRIKSAELWLKLGQPVPALLELQQLPKKTQRCPRAQQVYQDAVRNCLGGA